jgi:tetratricopeptide (TPR) repeat protein
MAMKLAAAALLCGALIATYAAALRVPFIFDDGISITRNPSIERLWPLVGDEQHPGPLNPPAEHPTAGRPLVNLTLALNYQLGGLNPLGYHIFNLIVHALSVLLLWRIVSDALRLEYFAGRFDRSAELLGFLAALLWAVHPLNTESVIYTTQRTELMVGFFYLATLYGSLRYWSSGRTTWLIVATAACMSGMACKEVMATAPLAVLLFEYTFIAGTFRKTLQRSWRLYAGLTLGWIVLLGLNMNAPRGGTAGFSLEDSPMLSWWLTQAKVFLIYLKLAVWPWPLTIHYEFPLLTAAQAWPYVLITTLIVLGTLLLLWRRSAVGFVGAWVMLILAPTSIVPLLYEVAAERRMYLPLAALCTLFIVGGCWLAQRARLARWASGATAGAGLIAAMICVSLSIHRLELYRDPIALWRDAIALEPQNYFAYNNLGVLLEQSGQTQQAIEQFQHVLQLRPDDPEANSNLGNILGKSGQSQQAIAFGQRALKQEPNSAEVHYNLAVQLSAAGQPMQAIAEYQKALQLKPDFAPAWNNLGLELYNLGQGGPAIECYQRALQFKEDYPDAHNNLANAIGAAGQVPQAIEHYQRALQLRPDYAEAHNNLGFALMRTGQLPQAIEQFQKAMQLKPNYTLAAENLARAYAQNRQPNEAIAAGQQAIAFAQANGQADMAKQVQDWLTSYQAGLSQPQP